MSSMGPCHWRLTRLSPLMSGSWVIKESEYQIIANERRLETLGFLNSLVLWVKSRGTQG